MTMMDKKSELQEKIITKYIKEKPSRSTIVLPTGVGKTRVALQIAENLFKSKDIKSCLIVKNKGSRSGQRKIMAYGYH